MILPSGFDSTKKYPSLTYVYNGPNVQTVMNTWMAGNDLFLYYMAQQGFVVFTVDGRGSDNRGLEFEQAIHRHLGLNEIADQKMGSNYLKSKSWIDGNRMAVYGWSYGGFMTTSMLTRTPDVYRCGVAGGAVIDWQYYEIMYTERYMDTPQENPEGYKEANTMNYVQNLKGKLLEIHGTSDDVVVWQHTLAYTQAAISKGVQTDYYMYPGHLHGVRGKDRIHLLTKISNYVIDNTK
jgi:dipeptidyl-peptidase-4